jgi:membrane fusion protein, cation efflux system
VGEKLVTQGGLSLYAESRKTQAAPSAAASASPQDPATNAHAHADAQGKPHSHDAAGNMNQQSSGLPMGVLAAVGGGAVLMIGAIVAIGAGRKKKSTFSNKKDGGF